jgi:CubicO group peptidase (beta-lactamase class C family)
MLIFPHIRPNWYDIRHNAWCFLFLALVACSGNSPMLTTTPNPTPSRSAQPVNHLPTPTPQLSGQLGSEIDTFLLKNHPLFSGSVLVSLDGQILLSSGYRYANWELNVPNTSSTIFRLTSLTKPFTALAIMLLQERGQLDVNDPICRYLVDCPTAWQPITIHHLLTHTSGIPDYAAFPNALREAAISQPVTELIDSFRDKPLDFPPGTRFEYSNSGYVLLGAVIKSVSGMSYAVFLFNNIFSPLSMKDSGYESASQIIKNRAGGYTIDGRALENSSHIDPSNLYSAGGLYSTVEDLYRWNQALNTSQLVSQPTLDKIFTPRVAAPKYGAEYGYGWIISESKGHPLVWHSGSLPGFNNYLAHYPDDHVDIIILSNLDTSDVLAIARGIEDIIFRQAE